MQIINTAVLMIALGLELLQDERTLLEWLLKRKKMDVYDICRNTLVT